MVASSLAAIACILFLLLPLHLLLQMGLSRRGQVSPGPPHPTTTALPWALPQEAMRHALLLPPEDQQILHHLVSCNSIFPKAKRKLQHVRDAGRHGWKKGKHPPAIGCACFDCYLSFWSRWSASPNLLAISDILDIVDRHALDHPSWQPPLSAALQESGGGRGRQKGKEAKAPNCRRGSRAEASIAIAPPPPPPPPSPPPSSSSSPSSSAAAAANPDAAHDGREARSEAMAAASAEDGGKVRRGLLDRLFKILWVE